MAKRLLLISNSYSHGGGYLEHCAGDVADFLGDAVDRVLFVPFALTDQDAYAATAREGFARIGKTLDSLHEAPDPLAAVEAAPSIFVGGGNTFRLLRRLYQLELLAPIRRRVEAGMPYMGASAGSNVACPTIRTTNDMPIVEPPSFDALGLVPFQINPHYLDPDPTSTHQGETREQRIREFHEENDRVVFSLREGALLWVEGSRITLRGSTGGRIFEPGREPREVEPGAVLDAFLQAGP